MHLFSKDDVCDETLALKGWFPRHPSHFIIDIHEPFSNEKIKQDFLYGII